MLENSNTRISCSKIDSYGNFLSHFKLVDLQTLCIGWKLIREERFVIDHVIQRPDRTGARPSLSLSGYWDRSVISINLKNIIIHK